MTNRRNFVKLSLAAALTIPLGACANNPPVAGETAQLGFENLAPVRLNVATVVLRTAYQSPLSAPNAEHLFAVTPGAAMMNWARRRLRAGGGAGNPFTAEFVIEDAKVLETGLAKTTGLRGLLTYEPTARYDATAVARLTIKSADPGASQGEVLVTVQRSIDVRENATLVEREDAWFGLTEALMADFNAQMETQIQKYLARWLDGPGL